ncbi:hypothetical protein PVAG01_08458 [Phlyctema vagabunda]|uniref:Uncharacterized protein n=1 Tax=Phlyctema vagabunda TaxID=108571 RepID=A0ABR4P9H3_9HELO
MNTPPNTDDGQWKTPELEEREVPSIPSSPISVPTPRTATDFQYQNNLLLNDKSLRELSDRTQNLTRLFSLSANSVNPIETASLLELGRVAVWWSLLARMKLGSLIRNEFAACSKQHIDAVQTQVFTYLSKAFWVLQEALQTTQDSNDGQSPMQRQNLREEANAFYILRLNILAFILDTITTMKRHDLFPESTSEPSLPHGLDTEIWVAYPSLKLDIDYLITGHHREEAPPRHLDTVVGEEFLIGDTDSQFYFGGMPTDIYLFNETSNSQQIRYPAILSITRSRSENHLAVLLASQNGAINLSITTSQHTKPNWNDVTWLPMIRSLEVRLHTGFRLQIRLGDWDYRRLKGVIDYHRHTLMDFVPSSIEQLIFETRIQSSEYINNRSDGAVFPSTPIANCALRLFEKRVAIREGTGVRHQHRGFRIAIITPPSIKHINVLTHDIVSSRAIQFGFLRGETGNPALSLKIGNDDTKSTLILGFEDPQERNTLLAYLTGCFVPPDEALIAHSQIKNVSFSCQLDSLNTAPAFESLQWQSLQVVNQGPAGPVDIENSKAVLSESLRIIMDSSEGRLTDRINVGIGELKIRRNVLASGHELQLLRLPQEDITCSLSEPVDAEVSVKVSEALTAIKSLPSIRTYSFPNLAELHSFQAAITGFSVLFDALVPSFSILRRRMMVPIYKEWTSSHTRVQILRRGRMYQIVAYFEGFSHGKCMNFALKGTDVFIQSAKADKHTVKIVDAKFSLPVGGKKDVSDEKGFVCLDFLEYPSEHDDIVIGFDTAAGMSTEPLLPNRMTFAD